MTNWSLPGRKEMETLWWGWGKWQWKWVEKEQWWWRYDTIQNNILTCAQKQKSNKLSLPHDTVN